MAAIEAMFVSYLKVRAPRGTPLKSFSLPMITQFLRIAYFGGAQHG
jgi:hypothetical protein